MGADYSQIELRVLAHMSGDEALIESFNNGEDIHRATAARVLGIPEDKITLEERSRAKAVNFGVIYGMSAFGLSSELRITRKDADEYIKAYFAKHAAVKEFMDEQVKFCKSKRLRFDAAWQEAVHQRDQRFRLYGQAGRRTGLP